MLRGDTEEPGEADGLDGGVEPFERPPEHLRAHVDAEGRLKRGPVVPLRLGRRAEAVGEAPLGRALGGFLKDLVNDVVGRGPHRLGEACARRRPAVTERVLVPVVERLLPEQPDREEVDQRAVRLAGELRLPQAVARELRPAAQRGEQAVEVGGQRGIVQAEVIHGARHGLHGALRGFRDEGGEALQPHDLRGDVVRGVDAEGGPGPLVLVGEPQCLTGVEIARRPDPETLGDYRRPVRPGDVGREVRHRRQRRRRGPILLRDRLQGLDRGGFVGIGRGGEGGIEVGVGDGPVGQALAVPGARHGDRAAAHAGEAGAGLGQALAGLAQVGIDRDIGGQGPERRDLAARGVDDRLEGLRVESVLGKIEGHGRFLHCQVERRTDQLPTSRSKTALA